MRTNTRLLSILLTMLTALTLFMIPAVESAALQVGDIDGDAKVTAKDARFVLRLSARLEPTATVAQRVAADVDQDMKITATDARIILRVSARMTTFEENINAPDNSQSIPRTAVNWLMLGDSITDLYTRPNNYPYWIKTRNPNVNITNMAIAGALVTWDRDDYINGRQIINVYHQSRQPAAVRSKPDVITILAGVNDFNWGVPLGSRNDGFGTTGYKAQAVVKTANEHNGLPTGSGTFYQAFSFLLENLRKDYPSVPIVVFTPFGTNNLGTGSIIRFDQTIRSFQNAIIEICRDHNVAFCNLSSTCIIATCAQADKPGYFFDNVHPNGEGSRELSLIIEREVRKVLNAAGKYF